jgi:hypothetical protein
MVENLDYRTNSFNADSDPDPSFSKIFDDLDQDSMAQNGHSCKK